MKLERRTYRLNFFMPVLGSQPTDKEIHAKYIASKANSPRQSDEETESIPTLDEKGVTAFYRRKADGALCLLDYQVMGHFKEALSNLAPQMTAGDGAADPDDEDAEPDKKGKKKGDTLKAARSKADKYLFVAPREIPFMRNGAAIMESDDRLQRPLRAQTMQGPRVSLACSEMIGVDNGAVSIEITMTLLANKDLNWGHVEEALEYGALKGLGQWRNGSYGRFTWEQV